MQADRAQISRLAILAAGFAVGALSKALVDTHQTREIAALKSALAEAESRFLVRQQEREAEWRTRCEHMEARLEVHEARLNDLPSAGQLVAVVEELLSKTMHSLDQRLSAQADSIDVLKTTVSQTDALLERVLESLEALRQTPAAAADASENRG